MMTQITKSNNHDQGEGELWQKILLRLRIIFFAAWGHDWPEIIFALQSAAMRRGEDLIALLTKRQIVSLDKTTNCFSFLHYKFYYSGNFFASILTDLVSIWGYSYKYFWKNFITLRPGFYEGPYENKYFAIKSGDYVVDAGANIGLFSALASEQVGPQGHVYACEPIAKTRAILIKNKTINNLSNVEIIATALGSSQGQQTFIAENNLGNSSGYFVEQKQLTGNLETVVVDTLDNLVASGLITRVDFIKADIEGMERELLAGAARTIEKFHPKLERN